MGKSSSVDLRVRIVGEIDRGVRVDRDDPVHSSRRQRRRPSSARCSNACSQAIVTTRLSGCWRLPPPPPPGCRRDRAGSLPGRLSRPFPRRGKTISI